jgi:hypothetical protein
MHSFDRLKLALAKTSGNTPASMSGGDGGAAAKRKSYKKIKEEFPAGSVERERAFSKSPDFPPMFAAAYKAVGRK